MPMVAIKNSLTRLDLSFVFFFEALSFDITEVVPLEFFKFSVFIVNPETSNINCSLLIVDKLYLLSRRFFVHKITSGEIAH